MDKETQIRLQEAEIEEWKNSHYANISSVFETINAALQKGFPKGYQELGCYIKNEKFLNNYARVSEIACLLVMLSIYEEEQKQEAATTIFDQGNSLPGLLRYYNKLKFCLWRMEFEELQDALPEAMAFIRETDTSATAVAGVIATSAFDRPKSSYRFAQVYRALRNDPGALKLLLGANRDFPGTECILCEIADIFCSYGNIQAAMEYVGQIQAPSALLEQYMRQWEKPYE